MALERDREGSQVEVFHLGLVVAAVNDGIAQGSEEIEPEHLTSGCRRTESQSISLAQMSYVQAVGGCLGCANAIGK